MWVASVYGWFSVTESSVEPGKIQVRARERADLEALRAASGIASPIIETPKADYRFRALVSRSEWDATIAPTLAASVRYPNFKRAIGDTPAQQHKLDAYHAVWATMHRLQPAADDGNKGRRKSPVPDALRHEGHNVANVMAKVRVAQFGAAATHGLAWAMEVLAGFFAWTKGVERARAEKPKDQLAEMRHRLDAERAKDQAWNESLCPIACAQLSAEAGRLIRIGDAAGLLQFAQAFNAFVANDGTPAEPLRRKVAYSWMDAQMTGETRIPTVAEVISAGVQAGCFTGADSANEEFRHEVRRLCRDMKLPLAPGKKGPPIGS